MEQDFRKVPEKPYRPDVRWWLAEGMHTDETLKNEMRMLDDMGMGAIEFLAMEEPGADSKLYGWGAEEWVHDTHTLVDEATKRRMGVSMTSGTNWSNANLISITPDDKAAAKELDFTEETLAAEESRSGELPKCVIKTENVHEQELIAVVAAKVVGERETVAMPGKDAARPVLAKETIVLTDRVKDGALDWTAPADGTYKLFFFWLHGTGQTASPSCAVSYTINYIDHYGIDAFIDYWDNVVLTEELRENLLKNGRGMMYMDSLELSTFGAGGQFWGYHFNEEFKKRRGYDITPYLPFVVKQGGMMPLVHDYHYLMDDEAFAEKFHNDLYQTMTDLYMDNMLKPMQEWLHGHGMSLRAEISYGLPFEISQPGKYVDGIETESLEFASQIESYRGLAGAAHIYNRIYSSETGATLLNYMMPLDFYNQIIFTQFAAGVTRTVFHGYSSICGSEGSTYWPGHEGMWPIFSERFGCRQPAYQHYNDWTAMIARYQKLLRAGKPRMDLGMLRLDYYFNNQIFGIGGTSECDLYGHQMMRGDEGMYWKDMNLQHAGYTWDYFAPQILEEDFTDTDGAQLYPDGPGYQALIVYQEVMPLATARKLLELAKKGQRIVFVNGVTEQIRPMGIMASYQKAASKTPFVMEADEELAEIIHEIKALPNVRETDTQADTIKMLRELGVEPRAAFAENNKNILTCMREDGDETNLFVYNMLYEEKEPVTVTLSIAGGGRPYEADCWNGEISEISGKEKDGRTEVTLTLNPGEATMLIFDRTKKAETLSADREYTECIPLEQWHLTVEDWNEGEKKVIIEDRGLGIVTKEVYYETKKTLIDAGEVKTIPWKDIPAVGAEVSGVGYYDTKVTLPESWSEHDGAVLSIGSTNGCTAAVYVNGQKAGAYNINKRAVEVGDLLRSGENTIRVEVSSSLNNRLLARGYYETSLSNSLMLMMGANNGNAELGGAGADMDPAGMAENMDGEDSPMTAAFRISTTPQDYGMTGEVVLKTYRKR